MASTGPGQGTRSPAITLLQVEALKLKPMICAPGGGLVAKLCLALATPWTVACQAPLSMGFSTQGSIPGSGRSPGEGEMVIYSSILA